MRWTPDLLLPTQAAQSKIKMFIFEIKQMPIAEFNDLIAKIVREKNLPLVKKLCAFRLGKLYLDYQLKIEI